MHIRNSHARPFQLSAFLPSSISIRVSKICRELSPWEGSPFCRCYCYRVPLATTHFPSPTVSLLCIHLRSTQRIQIRIDFHFFKSVKSLKRSCIYRAWYSSKELIYWNLRFGTSSLFLLLRSSGSHTVIRSILFGLVSYFA